MALNKSIFAHETLVRQHQPAAASTVSWPHAFWPPRAPSFFRRALTLLDKDTASNLKSGHTQSESYNLLIIVSWNRFIIRFVPRIKFNKGLFYMRVFFLFLLKFRHCTRSKLITFIPNRWQGDTANAAEHRSGRAQDFNARKGTHAVRLIPL